MYAGAGQHGLGSKEFKEPPFTQLGSPASIEVSLNFPSLTRFPTIYLLGIRDQSIKLRPAESIYKAAVGAKLFSCLIDLIC